MVVGLGLCAPVVAQDTLAIVFGTVVDARDRSLIGSLTIECYNVADTSVHVEAVIRKDGFYELSLMAQGTYDIVFDSPDHFPKRVRVELTGPSARQWKEGFGLDLDITLYKELADADLTFGEEPFGISRFNPGSVMFEWDMAYTKALKQRYASAIKSYEARTSKKK